MNDNATVLSATVRLHCCGIRCERYIDIAIPEPCDAEDVLSEARQEAEINKGWGLGLYCPEHWDGPKEEPDLSEDFDTGDFDPYHSR